MHRRSCIVEPTQIKVESIEVLDGGEEEDRGCRQDDGGRLEEDRGRRRYKKSVPFQLTEAKPPVQHRLNKKKTE